ncbi:MAG: ABC transporter ATP-binding protein [Xanthomonadales bacterium]|nr:ABC transporter ATP-binding protein [Xanthomonadales bacterium]
MLRLDGITKAYVMGSETVHALRGIDLDIARNESIAFIGSSGSGKSTLMNILGCLDSPSSGQYWLNGRDVATLSEDELAETRNREIGFVFQSFNLLPRASALNNVMHPLIYRGVRPAERQRRAREALDRVGLGNRVDHLPNQLSGGQRQRVAVARALVGEPSILLADEPTGNLDSATSEEIMALFDQLHRDGQTVVLVTHEPDIAEHCQRVVRLSDGKIISDVRHEPKKAPGHVQPA